MNYQEVINEDILIRNSKTTDSEIDIDDLDIEIDEDGFAQEDFYGQAQKGDYFGQLAL